MRTSNSLAVREINAPVVHEIVDAQIVSDRPDGETLDILKALLADKRSVATKRAYTGDLRDFFGGSPTNDELYDFLSWPPRRIVERVNRYKADMLAMHYSEATVNRRLASVRALLKLGHRYQICQVDGRNVVDSEKVTPYRDTRGIDVSALKELVKLPHQLYPGTRRKKDMRAVRDTAILRLLCEWALRRAELCRLNVEDFESRQRRLWILGKGRGSEKEVITLPRPCVRDIEEYLERAGHETDALFRNFDHRPEHAGQRLTTDAIFKLVKHYGTELGYPKLTPHKIRHSAITAALDATGGDMRRVLRYSRHKDFKTLGYYDDNLQDFGGEVANIVSGLLK